jgi:hypothetical protein
MTVGHLYIAIEFIQTVGSRWDAPVNFILTSFFLFLLLSKHCTIHALAAVVYEAIRCSVVRLDLSGGRFGFVGVLLKERSAAGNTEVHQ